MAVKIYSTMGYMTLDVWVMANIIQLGTQDFCKRFLNVNNDPCGRQYDQMTQAARSGVANIAEGFSRHQTSRETEMKLLDVARASLCELLGDYYNFLLNLNECPWEKESKAAAFVYGIALDKPTYQKDWISESANHILAQKAKFERCLSSSNGGVVANSLLCLCVREINMLEKFIQRLLEEFKEEGGFAENMSRERLYVIKNSSRDNAKAPNCPKCGAPMHKIITQRGKDTQREFWGCTNYRTTGCSGTLNIE